MKFNLVLIFGLVTLVALCSARPAEEEYNEYEEEAEAPKKAAPARPLIGRRNPLTARSTNKATSTTTTAAPQRYFDDQENNENDELDESIPIPPETTQFKNPGGKRNAPSCQNELLALACEHLRQGDGEYEHITKTWAAELKKMKLDQQLFAKRAINEILFEGQLGTLHRYSVGINKENSPLTSPTPSSTPSLASPGPSHYTDDSDQYNTLTTHYSNFP